LCTVATLMATSWS